MFPLSVGVVMKQHLSQKIAKDFSAGESDTPMEYCTVQWIAPASDNPASSFSIAGTISKVSLAQLQAPKSQYRLWRVTRMQEAFHQSQEAVAKAHSAAQVLLKLHSKQGAKEGDDTLAEDAASQVLDNPDSQVFHGDTESDDDEELMMLVGGYPKRRLMISKAGRRRGPPQVELSRKEGGTGVTVCGP
jgi:hypothetical protein